MRGREERGQHVWGLDLTARGSIVLSYHSLHVLQSPRSPQGLGTPSLESDGDKRPETGSPFEDERTMSEAGRGLFCSS